MSSQLRGLEGRCLPSNQHTGQVAHLGRHLAVVPTVVTVLREALMLCIPSTDDFNGCPHCNVLI